MRTEGFSAAAEEEGGEGGGGGGGGAIASPMMVEGGVNVGEERYGAEREQRQELRAWQSAFSGPARPQSRGSPA
jgi:hypothetical protein